MTDALLSVIVLGVVLLAVGVDVAAVVGSVFRGRHGLAVSLKKKPGRRAGRPGKGWVLASQRGKAPKLTGGSYMNLTAKGYSRASQSFLFARLTRRS